MSKPIFLFSRGGASIIRPSFVLLLSIFAPSQSLSADEAIRNWPAAEIRIVDARLSDMNGSPIDFARDAIKDRIVAINFIYSSCRTLCPLSSATFKLLQDRLSDRLGKDVWLISLTLDPQSDTPDRLREFADQFEPAPAWLWLTGAPANMETVLQGLGVSVANFREHAPLTLIGDAKFGRWTQLNAMPSPTQIEAELKRLWAAREVDAAAEPSAWSAQDKAPTP